MRSKGVLFHVGRCVDEIRKRQGIGSVIGIFSTSLYIGYPDGDVILIYTGEYGYIPFGAQITKRDLEQLKAVICMGMQVRMRRTDILFGVNEAVLEIEDTWFMDDGEETKTYDVSWEAWKKARDFLGQNAGSDGFGGMIRCMEMICADTGISCGCEDKMFCRYAAPWVRGLADSRHGPDREWVDCCVSHLLGVGIGLTPSGDDFLTGFCYGILRLKNINTLYKKELRECMISLGPAKTTVISNAYVRASAMGEYYHVLEKALDALCGRGKVYEAFAQLLKVGNSSGREMGLGLLFSAYLAEDVRLKKGGA